MKVNCQNNRDISFSGLYNNKALKKMFEFAADNGTLFGATATIAFSSIRPLAILATPDTDKKNKQVACSKSIISLLNGFLLTLIFSNPLSRSIRKIDSNPARYLKKTTIDNLLDGKKSLVDSKAYSMATQLFKLGLGFLIAVPKSIINAFGTPYALRLFNTEDSNKQNNSTAGQSLNFKGKSDFAKKIGKIIDNKKLQDFVKANKDSNFPLHIMAATDTLSTVVFAHQVSVNRKLEEKDKKPLIYNSIFSTVLSIASTYLIDGLTKGQTDKFIQNFCDANKNDSKLSKYVEGIRIAKPIIIAGLIYYILIPLISTYFADRIPAKKTY